MPCNNKSLNPEKKELMNLKVSAESAPEEFRPGLLDSKRFDFVALLCYLIVKQKGDPHAIQGSTP
jgi:hypothetical protein